MITLLKKLAIAVAFSLLFYIPLFAQNAGRDVRCIVLDEKDAPMEFATIAVLSLPDSTILCGGMTDEHGILEINLPRNSSIVQITMMGYYMEEFNASEFDSNQTVRLRPDVTVLEGAMVVATLPKTEIKGDAVITNISGSVLEHNGNAVDVLAKVPGIISRNGVLEVIGRGAPIYYINGRKVTDNSELRNLMSEDIKSVEVVNNPGSLYGGDVRSVVRIRTVRRQGDGFSFALSSQAKQHIYQCSDFDLSWSVLDLNYRVKGWDFFGKVVNYNEHSYQISTIDAVTYLEKPDGYHKFKESGTLDYRNLIRGMQYEGGSNWQINENHSLGLKIVHDKWSSGSSKLIMNTDIFLDGIQDDFLSTVNDAVTPINKDVSGNIYYDGNLGKLNINFNADFLSGTNESATNMKESSWISPAELSSEQRSKTKLGAGKLLFSYPVWKGKIQFGAEETFVSAGQTYSITFSGIPATDASLTENTIAGFAEYAAILPFGQFSAGLRFEHASYSYYDHLKGGETVKDNYNNWFPSFSFSTMAGPVALSLSYTGKTQRPSFGMLTTEISYNNRYCYQSGDPMLLSEKRRTGSLNANWKWLTFSGSYEKVDNFFVQWANPYNDQGVVLIRNANLEEPLRKLSFYLIATPTVGIWNPRYTVGMDKQFLDLTLEDPMAEGGCRTISLDKPMFVAQLDNAFRFKRDWVVEANYSYISKMNTSNAYVYKPIQNASLSVQKTFLKDALTLRLTWTDIFNSSVVYARTDFGRYIIDQPNDSYTPCVTLQLSYRFNSASNKYKGTGAGESAKSRL